ncbi:hypothetical protein [Peribacillus simplex]
MPSVVGLHVAKKESQNALIGALMITRAQERKIVVFIIMGQKG